MPVCSGENLYGSRDFRRYLEAGGMDVASVDVIWNGFHQAKKIADLAETFDVLCAHGRETRVGRCQRSFRGLPRQHRGSVARPSAAPSAKSSNGAAETRLIPVRREICLSNPTLLGPPYSTRVAAYAGRRRHSMPRRKRLLRGGQLYALSILDA